ncbi:Ig-like domain repeat protein, partial [Candidatus Pacearchaeota archaeon]|nr:Ig-like domain repeat protein [Candidatus Pacearchaeota archaeon]
MKDKLKKQNERRIELIKRIGIAESYKKNVLSIVQELVVKYQAGEISHSQYYEKINEIFGEKKPEERIKYYDNYIANCEDLLKDCEKRIARGKIKIAAVKFVPFILFFVFLIFAFNSYKVGITGLFVEDENETLKEEFINGTIPEIFQTEQAINETQPIQQVNVTINETTDNETSQEIIINETKITLPEKIIVNESNITIEPSTNETEDIFNYTNASVSEIFNESKINITEKNITTKRARIIVGRPVKWIKIVEFDERDELRIELPKNAENISVKTGEEIQEAIVEIENYNKLIEETNKINLISGEITGNVALDIRESRGVLTRILNWLRKFTITGGIVREEELELYMSETTDGKEVDLTEFVEQTKIDKLVVEYYTEGPNAIEEDIGRGKRVIVSSQEEENYTDVLAFAEIPEIFDIGEESKIKIYWREENEYINFSVYDLDEDEKIDYVEWNIPHLSEQTFDIILVTKAEHLSSNHEFISDIYEEVKELDGNWSEPIYQGEYVRVSFEQNLTSENDITLFPRTILGAPKIEVYENNGSEIIAQFDNLTDDEYNRVFLDGSSGFGIGNKSRDTFDLRIIDGAVEIEHIIDPNITFSSTPAIDISVVALDNRTFVFAQANGGNITFKVFDTNGTSLTGFVGVPAVPTGAGSRVSAGVINSTAFAVAWFNAVGTVQDTTYSVFRRDGTKITGPTDLDTSSGTVGDPARPILMSNATGSFMQICHVDQGASDADVNIIPTKTWSAGTGSPSTGADGTITPTLTSQNMIDCAALNSSAFVYAFVDYADNDTTAVIMNTTGTANTVSATIDIDGGTVGRGQVAVTTINQTYFAFAWYNNLHTTINVTVRTVSGVFLAPTLVDKNASGGGTVGTPRLRMATVRERTPSEANNWFILAWNDRQAGNINATVYNVSGFKKYNYLLASDQNVSSPLFDIYGRDELNNLGTCDETFIFAYTNNSGGTLAKTLYINGSEWNGVCGAVPATDDEYPLFSNFAANPANNSAYSSGTDYQFNATILSTNGTVGIEFNGVNYTAWNSTASSPRVFNFTFTDLAGGTYTYYWWAYGNGTDKNYNLSSTKDYTIAKATSGVNLTLNHTSSNITISSGTSIWLNATLTKGDIGNILLYNNGTLINNKTSPAVNLTTFSVEGFYNISAYYVGSANYTANWSYSYWVNVTSASNTPPKITFIEAIPDTDPTEDNFFGIEFYFTMNDSDGVDDLNDAGVVANFTRAGEPLRQNSSCSPIPGANTTTSQNYSCTIDMWYFDDAGLWNITLLGKDIGGEVAQNVNTTFQYNLLKAIQISHTALSFDASIGAENQTSTNDPTLINNTGNYNAVNISFVGINLHGEENSSFFIDVANISVGLTTGAANPECNGALLFNGTVVNITGTSLNRGNHSINNGTLGQEQFYYCILIVPRGIPSQTYSTSSTQGWRIIMLAAAFAIGDRAVRRKKRSLIVGELSIPITIFSKELGALEAITKYMKENLSMDYHEIAKLLNRDDRTIWTAYNKAKNKEKKIIKVEKSLVWLPASIFEDRRLTPLESVVVYLKEKELRYSEISKLLNRDQRNIWAIYSKTIKKLR